MAYCILVQGVNTRIWKDLGLDGGILKI